jgi:hypothetical protein
MAETQVGSRNANFVEHLRLIHFTMLAVCLAALVAITSTAPSYLERSAEETNQLLALGGQWQTGEWLQKVIADKKSALSPSPASATKMLSYRFGSERKLFVVPQPGHDRGSPLPDGGARSWFVLATKLGDDGHALTVNKMRFETVADAQATWNMLDRFRYAVTFTNARDGWYVDGAGKSADLKFEAATENASRGESSANAVVVLNLYLRADLLDHFASPQEASQSSNTALLNVRRDSSSCYLYAANLQPPAGRYILRADCASEPINLQLLFVRGLSSPRPGLGDFAHAFPNLDDLTKHLTGLSLADLQLFIDAEKKRSGEKVEILGAKLPEDSVAFWGTILLLALTGYFWVIFRDFVSREMTDEPTVNVPWIGYAKDRTSRLAFIVSLAFVFYTSVHLTWAGVDSEVMGEPGAPIFGIQLYNPKHLLYGLCLMTVVALLVAIFLDHRRISEPRLSPRSAARDNPSAASTECGRRHTSP